MSLTKKTFEDMLKKIGWSLVDEPSDYDGDIKLRESCEVFNHRGESALAMSSPYDNNCWEIIVPSISGLSLDGKRRHLNAFVGNIPLLLLRGELMDVSNNTWLLLYLKGVENPNNVNCKNKEIALFTLIGGKKKDRLNLKKEK